MAGHRLNFPRWNLKDRLRERFLFFWEQERYSGQMNGVSIGVQQSFWLPLFEGAGDDVGVRAAVGAREDFVQATRASEAAACNRSTARTDSGL
jgi:hypothetical protein